MLELVTRTPEELRPRCCVVHEARVHSRADIAKGINQWCVPSQHVKLPYNQAITTGLSFQTSTVIMSKSCFPCNPCTANPSWKQTVGSIICMSLSITVSILAVSIYLSALLPSDHGWESNRHLLEMLNEMPPYDDNETQEHPTQPRKRSSSQPPEFTPMMLIMCCSVFELLQEDLVTDWFSFSRLCTLILKCGGKGFAEGMIILMLLRSGLLV